MSLFSDFHSEDGEWELDNPVETCGAVTQDDFEENGTPVPCVESFLDREAVNSKIICEDQGGTALERTLGQLKRVGWTGTIESFRLAQTNLLTKKCYKKKREGTPEVKIKIKCEDQSGIALERTLGQLKRVGWTGTIESFRLAQANLLTKKCYKKKHEVTPEERERRLLKCREYANERFQAKRKNETSEEREKRLEKIRSWRILRESKRSEAEKEKILERKRKRQALKRANETREEREKRNAFFREYQRNQRKRYAEELRPRKQLSEAERAIMLEKRKVRYSLKAAAETPEEREKRLAKLRARSKSKPKRDVSPGTMERRRARRRELYWQNKLLKPTPTKQKNLDVKIEDVHSSVLEVPTNHFLHLEATVEPDNFQEPLLIFIKKEI